MCVSIQREHPKAKKIFRDRYFHGSWAARKKSSIAILPELSRLMRWSAA
jgi:hypothetical protein